MTDKLQKPASYAKSYKKYTHKGELKHVLTYSENDVVRGKSLREIQEVSEKNARLSRKNKDSALRSELREDVIKTKPRRSRGPGLSKRPFAGKRGHTVSDAVYDSLTRLITTSSFCRDATPLQMCLWYRVHFSKRLRAHDAMYTMREKVPLHLKSNINVPPLPTEQDIYQAIIDTRPKWDYYDEAPRRGDKPEDRVVHMNITIELVTKKFQAATTLNGSNGEATNSDDTPPKAQVGQKKKKANFNPRRPKQRKQKNELGSVLNTKLNPPKPMKMIKPTNRGYTTSGLSECAAKLAVAFANPWAVTDVCLPTHPARPTKKDTGFARFDMVIGTGGYGVCLVMPAIASNTPVAIVSNGTYTGTAATIPDWIVNSTQFDKQNMGNLPFNISQIWNNTMQTTTAGQLIQGRIACVGATASYTGKTLDQAGLVVCYSSPEHEDLSQYSYSTIQGFLEADVANTSRKKCTLSAIANCEQEYSFDRSGYANAISGANAASLAYEMVALYPWGKYVNPTVGINSGSQPYPTVPMVIHCQATPGSSLHIEIVTHVEYVGNSAQTNVTPTVSDPVGLDRVVTAAGRVPGMKQANPGTPLGTLMQRAILAVANELVPVDVKSVFNKLARIRI